MSDNNKDFQFEEEFENSQELQEDQSVEEIIEIEDGLENSLVDESEDMDETIEIEEDEVVKEDVPSEVVLSKHTINRKHSLSYDSIFKGKKEDPLTEDDSDVSSSFNENFEVDKSSIYWYESVDNENYIKEKRIKEKVYEVLANHTDINFLNNRRKPSRSDFNNFYYLLKTNLQDENFTNVEIFNELAVYFSDNLFNMFKLLDNKWRNMIISELQDHIGKQPYSKEVMNRNIHLGTEIEFLGEDPNNPSGDSIHITGVVIETDYEYSIYQVDSYEKIYEVELTTITKILNNTKFKYNLNKLNNIDFL
jgi:hypothetical protein